MHEISKLKANDETAYQEGIALLKTEAAEDEQARAKHGTVRWTRQPSSQAAERLYAQVTEIEGYLKSAASSDELVKKKFKECERDIQVLSGSKMDLEASVPSSRRATLTPPVEKAADNLRSALSEVSKLERRRKNIIQEMRQKVKDDDISTIHEVGMRRSAKTISQTAPFSQKQHASNGSIQCRKLSLPCSKTSLRIDLSATTRIRW